MKYAEKSGTKFTRTYDWSPRLIQAVQTKRYWRLLLKRSKGHPVAQSTIDLTRNAAGLPLYSQDYYDRPYIVQKLREALKNERFIQQHHDEERETYLTHLATAKVLHRAPHLSRSEFSTEREHSIRKEIQELIKRERKKKQYSKIGKLLNPNLSSRGLTRIDIPAANTLEPYPVGPDPKTWTGPWRSITDPGLIAKHVCASNLRQYNQAQHTPFGTGYLAECFGLDASTDQVKDLLAGTFQPDPNSIQLQETVDILHQISQPLQMTPKHITNVITPDQFVNT